MTKKKNKTESKRKRKKPYLKKKMRFVFFLQTSNLHLIKHRSLNPVPNAQMCVYLTIHITKLQLQTTFPKPLYIPHSACIHRHHDR